MMEQRHYFSLATLVLLSLVTLGIWLQVLVSTPPGRLTVAFLNVGQGDAIYIQSPTGAEVLIDGGPGNAVLKELPHVMRAGDRSLDVVVATHPDADHISGLIDVFDRYEVGTYLAPGIPKDTLTAQALEERVSEEKSKRYAARRGMVLELGGGAVLEVLYPNFNLASLSSRDTNEGGVVARLKYGSTAVLFMADVSSEVEARVAALEGGALDVDVLKVGHHGSRFSTSEAFLRAAMPEIAVISVGKNSYGHPTTQVLGYLSEQNIKTLRTDEEGTIVFVSSGGEPEFK